MSELADEACGARFTITDQYNTGDYHCSLNIHEGPHRDRFGNYTWGVIVGFDGYTQERINTLQARKARRAAKTRHWFTQKRNFK